MFYIKYFCAQCYDAFIVCALYFAFTALCLLIQQGTAIPPGTLWYQLSLLMIFFVYYTFSVKYGGQTMGMRAWGFKLTACHGKQLSITQVSLRLLLYFPSLVLSIIFLKPPFTLLRQWSNTKTVSI